MESQFESDREYLLGFLKLLRPEEIANIKWHLEYCTKFNFPEDFIRPGWA